MIRNANMYEIASKTGFSPSTVARALRGEGYVRKETREMILKVADELGYAPNQAARTLKNNITQKIMFCVPDIMNPYYFQMIRGVSDVLEQHGYYTIISYSEHNTEREIKIIEALNTRFVDGMILGSFDFNTRLMDEVGKSRYPMVLTNLVKSPKRNCNFDCVYIDHVHAVYIATEHLIQRGHKNICLLGGSLAEQTGAERAQGYKKALSDYEIEYRDELVIQSDFTREGAYRDFSAFMKGGVSTTAVVACSDLMGVSVMNYCREHNMRTPEDVAVATLDDTEYSQCIYPRLTSVGMMQYQIGALSAELLMKHILGERTEQQIVRLEPKLIIREST